MVPNKRRCTMNDVIISILAAAVLSAIVLFSGTTSAELTAMNSPSITGIKLNLNVSYPAGSNLTFSSESDFGLSAGYISGLADFPPIQTNILRAVEQARLYRDRLRLI